MDDHHLIDEAELIAGGLHDMANAIRGLTDVVERMHKARQAYFVRLRREKAKKRPVGRPRKIEEA